MGSLIDAGNADLDEMERSVPPLQRQLTSEVYCYA
jgi:hypothetical protein